MPPQPWFPGGLLLNAHLYSGHSGFRVEKKEEAANTVRTLLCTSVQSWH